MGRLGDLLHARYRAFAPLSCWESPRPDVLSGWRRWRWLARQRAAGRSVDPSVEVRCAAPVDERLRLGRHASIDRGCILWIADDAGCEGSITLGGGAYIGPYSYLGSCHALEIGGQALIGAYSYLITVNHRIDDLDLPVAKQGYQGGDISIGRNAWLGCHAVVLPGVTVGENAVVGAGAVVNRSVPPNEIWAGVPARKIGERRGGA